MQAPIVKTKRYIEQYITSVKWLRSLIIPALVALVAYNFFEIKTYQSMARITSKEENKSERMYTSILFCIYFVLGYTMMLLYEIFNAYFVATSLKNGITNFFGEFLKVDYKSFTDVGIGEAQYCISRRVYSLIEFLSSVCIDFVSNLLFFLIAIGSLSKEIKSVKLKIMAFFCVTGFVALSSVIQCLRSKVRAKVNLGFEKSSRKLYDILYNYERIVAYDNLDYELGKYRESMDDQVFYSIIFWVSFEIISFLNVLFFLFINVYFLSVLGVSANEGLDLKSFALVFNKLREKVMYMVESIDSLANNFVNLDQSVIEGCPLDKNEHAMDFDVSGSEIDVENLSFAYGSKVILEKFSTKIYQGEKVAITGPNGSGKSTFVKLLEGLYSFDGTVRIDGYDYRHISKVKLRESMSYVPQASFLFDLTIMENLKCGNRYVSDEKVVEYAKLYNMHELFKELGYNMRVGERGKCLSGGQRQKICFMRAVIKNAPILILDEATSNMDQESELEVVESIKKHMPSKTVIMIVHNLELLRHFDKVIFFGTGGSYEEGSFEQLVARDGSFNAFYECAKKHQGETHNK